MLFSPGWNRARETNLWAKATLYFYMHGLGTALVLKTFVSMIWLELMGELMPWDRTVVVVGSPSLQSAVGLTGWSWTLLFDGCTCTAAGRHGLNKNLCVFGTHPSGAVEKVREDPS